MKSKALALYSGIVGLVGGIYLLIAPFLLLAAVAGVLLPTILKIAILVLGIVAIVYYKGESRVGSAPSVLLIVGGAVGLIPALGWVGGILAIIGGSLFLGSLKKFKVEG